MNQKEIYGVIEFIDHEVRFVLGEFHNNQLNILNTQSLYTEAIDKIEIVDNEQLIQDVRNIISNVSTKMGFSINKILLLIPSYATNRYSKRIKIINSNQSEYFSLDDIIETINKGLNIDYNKNELVINKVVNRYIIDGLSSNKLDLDKKISRLYIDIDIYTGSKALIFDYLNIIEKAGFEVLNIYLESYAMAKEMALIDPSRRKKIVLIRYERSNLTMSLINKGRVVSSVMLDTGYIDLVEKLVEGHNISKDNAEKLILTNNYLSIQNNQVAPLFLYEDNSGTQSIDDKYLNDLLLPILEKQFAEISEMLKLVLEDDNSEVFITGKGASIIALGDFCRDIIKSPTKVYYPAILGARKGSLVACLGSIYAYKDISIFGDNFENSIDDTEFQDKIEINKNNQLEDSMSNRFKELFKINKDN